MKILKLYKDWIIFLIIIVVFATSIGIVYIKPHLELIIKDNTLFKNGLSINRLSSRKHPLSEEEMNRHIVALQELAKKGNSSALTELTALADSGNANAQAKLAMLYANGEGVETNLEKAISLYRASAKKGNSVAELNLGFYYEAGTVIKQDYEKAAELYARAMENKDITVKTLAQFNLANLYRQGLGVEQNIDKAIALYEAITKNEVNHPQSKGVSSLYKEVQAGSLTALGHIARSKQDLNKAREYYTAAADLGNITAKTNLGYDYLVGNGVAKDLPKAIELLSYAADRGEPTAQTNLGLCYLDGVGVKKDLKKAIALFKAAANQGDSKAEAALKLLKEKQ